ncbi:hypothetical protein QT397_20650 [Microbulbifer sp. MKSA007]|nr:hypothetical protein QT397_20650 [Microbulbifer sp. MKSA007]
MTSGIDELINHLKERADFYIKHYQPTYDFCDEVVFGLSKFSTDDYKLQDIFPREIIEEHILEHCLSPLQADVIGGGLTSYMSTNQGGAKEIDYSSTISIYKRVVNEWRKKDWVEIEYDAEKLNFPIAINLVSIRD